jgi:hypothetical protein
MNNAEAHRFLAHYFKRLFVDRDPSVLDECLHPEYHDDDIGPDCADHIRNSKEYLTALWRDVPTIGVAVRDTVVADDVIAAHLEWFHLENGKKVSRQKGVGIFVMEDGRIRKRHNYLYFRKEGL